MLNSQVCSIDILVKPSLKHHQRPNDLVVDLLTAEMLIEQHLCRMRTYVVMFGQILLAQAFEHKWFEIRLKPCRSRPYESLLSVTENAVRQDVFEHLLQDIFFIQFS